MNEFVALLMGAGCGWLFVGRLGWRRSVVPMAAAAMVVGVLVSWWAGELARSIAFAAWDATQAVVAGTAVALIAEAVPRRRRRHDADTR